MGKSDADDDLRIIAKVLIGGMVTFTTIAILFFGWLSYGG